MERDYIRLDYWTSDRSLVVDFVFWHRGARGWRIYIISQIDYRGRNCSSHAAHWLHDTGDDYPYICSTPILAEGDLIRYYLQALSEILADKDRYISTCKAQMDEANALEKIRFKREKAEVALAKDMAKIQALVRENAYISQDQQVYRQRFEEMSEQIEKQKNTIAELQEQELRLVGVREKLYRFIEALESFDAEPTFDSVTWNALVERVLVNPKSLIFEFKNGEKIKITI